MIILFLLFFFILSVCDDEFGREEGSVVCRMLGLPGGVKIHNQAAFGEGEVGLDISRYYLHRHHIYHAGPHLDQDHRVLG